MNFSLIRILPLAFAGLVLAFGCSADLDVADQSSDDATGLSQDKTESDYPVAVDASKVGSYPKLTKSGGGYFYDDVLEYRVWVDYPDGDDYRAFATFEEALEFSDATNNAEEPLVLVLQNEHVNEPEAGVYEHVKTERITEWRVEWLDGSKRSEN